MNKEFVIIGASGHAKVIIEIIEEMNGRIVDVIDTNPLISSILGYQVKHQPIYSAPVIVAIGNNQIRNKVVNSISADFAVAIHPKAIISKTCKVQVGTVIMGGATINAESVIGKHCIINTNASIDHDCIISNFVHISPNASVAGNVEVGEGTHIGIGSTVIQGIKIGKWATIGAGAVVIKDVPDYAIVVGVPGKIIKYNRE